MAPFCYHSEPNCEPNVADLTGCSFAAAAFDRLEITMPANQALRFARRGERAMSESCSRSQI